MNATATFETEYAARYLVTLCKHFAQRVPAQHDERVGTIKFPFGQCRLSVHDDILTLVASANDTVQLEQVVDVVSRHFERFAFRENPLLEWQPEKCAIPDTQTPKRG